MHLESKIYRNNMNVSIQWVQIHVKSLREENLFSQYSYFSQSVKNLVNKSIIHHKCHNFIGLYPKPANLIKFSQIGYDFTGDSSFSRVGCQVYINCLGQGTVFTLGQSGLISFSYSQNFQTTLLDFFCLPEIFNISTMYPLHAKIIIMLTLSFRLILVQNTFAKIYEHVT